MKKADSYIVLYSPDWDSETLWVGMIDDEGYLYFGAPSSDVPAVGFTSRDDAKKTIEISRRYELLNEAKGELVNTDLLERKNIRIVPVVNYCPIAK